MKKTNDHGFTLLELMFVVGIIALIAAIAIPNMLRARSEANEASAIGDLRVIGAAQLTYNAQKSRFGDFEELTEPSAGPSTSLLSNGWQEGRTKSGYTFTMPVVSATSFECYADPSRSHVTGNRFFRVDSTGIVRYDEAARPAPTAPQVGSGAAG